MTFNHVPNRSRSAFAALLCGIGCTVGPAAIAQSPYQPQGSEFSVSGGLRGEQTNPSAAIGSEGGFVVWEDNAIDGSGTGIAARRVDSNLNPSFGAFRVNEGGEGDQSNAKVALIPSGGAAFVWQSKSFGVSRVVARFADSAGRFTTGDVAVSPDNGQDASIAVQSDGTVVITWANVGSDGSMQGVYAQRISSSGVKIGEVRAVNITTKFNQKSPATTVLADGRVVIAWISEQQRAENSVDVYARVFDSQLAPNGGEVLVNGTTNICANPSIAAISGGGFTVGWSQRDNANRVNGWDVFARSYDSHSQALGAEVRVNETTVKDQYAPHLAPLGSDILAVWTSVGQDGSREGIYGRVLAAGGQPAGSEFKVNTTTVSRQIQPSVASDGNSDVLVVWTGFTGISNGFDVFAQRYSKTQEALNAPDAPIVSAVSSSRLSVSWAPVVGLGSVVYELYINGDSKPIELSSTVYQTSALAPSTKATFALAYRLSSGQRTPVSLVSSGSTWGEDANGDGLPDDWQRQYFGEDQSKWTGAAEDPDHDGASNLKELLAGTNPNDGASVLKTRIDHGSMGRRLVWNTQQGLVYQVQQSKDLTAWEAVGGPRFAAGKIDSLTLPEGSNQGYFRVIRLK